MWGMVLLVVGTGVLHISGMKDKWDDYYSDTTTKEGE